MRLAEQLKEQLTVEQVVRQYGYHPMHGKMPCPFHGETQPSFVLNKSNKSFKCYGCGAAGTVIDFTMKLFGINFGQACLRLNNDFALGLTDAKPNKAEIIKRRKEQFKKQRHEKEIAAFYDGLCKKYKYWKKILDSDVAEGMCESFIRLHAKAQSKINELEFLFYEWEWLGEEEWWQRYHNLQQKTF